MQWNYEGRLVDLPSFLIETVRSTAGRLIADSTIAFNGILEIAVRAGGLGLSF